MVLNPQGVKINFAIKPERLRWIQDARIIQKLFETAMEAAFMLTSDPQSSTPEDLFLKLIKEISEMDKAEYIEFKEIIDTTLNSPEKN